MFEEHVSKNDDEHRKITEYVDRVDRDLALFKNFCESQNQHKVADILKVKPKEVLSDNFCKRKNDIKDYSKMQNLADLLEFKADEKQTGSPVNQPEDAAVNQFGDHTTAKVKSTTVPDPGRSELTAARLFSFQQLYDFFNLCLNRSFLSKRTRGCEQDIYDLQQELKEFHEWREALEPRINKKIDHNFELFEEQNIRTAEEFQRNYEQHAVLDKKIETLEQRLNKTNHTIKNHKEKLEDHIIEHQALANLVTKNQADITKELEEQVATITERQDTTEQENTAAFISLAKDIDKQKLDITEMIDTKFEFINKSVDGTMKNITATFDEMSSALKKTNAELNNNFKDKVHSIKSMVATFFAKTEKQVTDNEAKTRKIEHYFDQFQANFINPGKEVEGKLYAIDQKIFEEELARESQFTHLRDAVQKLLYSLESQATSNL